MGVPIKTAIGTSLAIIVPTAIMGSAKHFHQGNIDWKIVGAIVPLAIAGSFLGAWMTQVIKPGHLQRGFAILMVYMGFRLFFQNIVVKRQERMPHLPINTVSSFPSFRFHFKTHESSQYYSHFTHQRSLDRPSRKIASCSSSTQCRTATGEHLGFHLHPTHRACEGTTLKGHFAALDGSPMQPFREHVETQINERFLTLLKKEAGIDLAQWNRLAKGQTALALIPGKDSLQIKPLLLIDSGGEVGPMNELTEKLTSVLTEKGQPFARETIEGISMIHIPLPLEGTLLDPSNEEGAQGLCVAQAESTLLVTTSRVTLQQIMRRAGGQSAGRTLSENPRFQMMEKDHFQGSLIHGWIQFPPYYRRLRRR